MPRNPIVHPNSAQAKASCDRCPKRGAGVVLRTRLDCNLVAERARLCDPCARAGGYTRAFEVRA